MLNNAFFDQNGFRKNTENSFNLKKAILLQIAFFHLERIYNKKGGKYLGGSPAFCL